MDISSPDIASPISSSSQPPGDQQQVADSITTSISSIIAIPPSSSSIESLPLSQTAPHIYNKFLQYEQRQHRSSLLYQHHHPTSTDLDRNKNQPQSSSIYYQDPKLFSSIASQVSISSTVLDAINPTTTTTSNQQQTLLLDHMSHSSILRLHLSDCLILIEGLLESLNDAAFLNTNLNNINNTMNTASMATMAIIDKVIQKEELMQQAVQSLIQHQQREQQMAHVREEIHDLDRRIRNFTYDLGQLEAALYTQIKEDSVNKTSLSSSSSSIPMNVLELVRFAHELSLRSFAPTDFSERKGISLAKPPAPLEAEMGNSLLQLSLQELLTYSRQINKTTDINTIIGIEKKEQLPSFKEVEQAAATAAAAAVTNNISNIQLVNQAPRRAASIVSVPGAAAATAAAMSLDLDLNPDLDESDDDEDESDDD